MASTCPIVRALRLVMCAGGILGLSLPAAAQAPAPVPAAQAQELREELDKLRKEFDAVRDAYGARLSALEEKLTAIGAPAPPAAPGPPTAPAQAAANSDRGASADRRGRERRAARLAAGVRQHERDVEIFNPDIAVIGDFIGAAGRNTIDPIPALALNEAEATFQAVVDPYARADFFLAFSPEGVEIEEGFLTLTSLPGGLLAKVGSAQGTGRQGEHAARACAPVGRRAADDQEPVRRRRRAVGLRGVGLEVDPQPLHVPRGDRRDLCGLVGAVQVIRAQRCELGGPAARLP